VTYPSQHQTLRLPRLLPLAGLAGVLFFSCMASPPSTVLAFEGGRVLAADDVEAQRIEALMGRLRPAVVALLPDAAFEDLEVWVQDRPRLYRFPSESTSDAEGLWSPTHRRIMLSRHADHLERTLAHELTHAVLGETWAMLPGSLEEGLADHVSAALVDEGAARLRAGRLSSAMLATGGLEIDVDVLRPRADVDLATAEPRGWAARVRLSGDAAAADPLDVFRLSAGLSSTRLDTGTKRGFYGLAYLVVAAVVDRGGYGALHALCAEAEAEGLDGVPMERVLAAAGLDADAASWRARAAASMSEDDVIELVRMYPAFLVDALADYVDELEADDPVAALRGLDVRVRVVGSDVSLALGDLPFVEQAVVALLVPIEARGPRVAAATR